MKMRGMALACATHACASAAGNEVDVARARGSGGGTDRGHRWKVGKPVGFNNCGKVVRGLSLVVAGVTLSVGFRFTIPSPSVLAFFELCGQRGPRPSSS